MVKNAFYLIGISLFILFACLVIQPISLEIAFSIDKYFYGSKNMTDYCRNLSYMITIIISLLVMLAWSIIDYIRKF